MSRRKAFINEVKMKILKTFGALILVAFLAACGQKVEIPPAAVGKIMTKDGYKEGVRETSKFRLDMCMNWCDKLVVLKGGDFAVSEPMELVMPQDKLKMTFRVQMTLSVNPSRYDEVFNRVPPSSTEAGDIDVIDVKSVYNTYAQQIIRAEARENLSRYKISDILSNLDNVNAELSEALSKSISSKTPFQVRFVGLADVNYPPIIVEAQENAAKRREMIEQENAQLEISKVELARELQEEKLRRAIDVEKAQAEAAVNKILADSMTDAYTTYRQLQIMEKLAVSDNKVFVPMGSLNTIAVQNQIGK